MAHSDTVSQYSEPPSDTAAIQHTREYYFAILAGSDVYHVAHEGVTTCGVDLHGERRWFKRGSERTIPPELRLCRDCDATFHRELALSKAHIREELATLSGFERDGSGPFKKEELAELLATFRGPGRR